MNALSFELDRSWDNRALSAHEASMSRLIQRRRDLLEAAVRATGQEVQPLPSLELLTAPTAATAAQPREILAWEIARLDDLERELFRSTSKHKEGKILLEDCYWREGNRLMQALTGTASLVRDLEATQTHRSGIAHAWDEWSSWRHGITPSRASLAAPGWALGCLDSEAPFRSNPRTSLWVVLWRSTSVVEGVWIAESAFGALAQSCWIQWMRGALHALDPRLQWTQRSEGKFELRMVR